MAPMKTLLAVLAACAALSGCVVAPIDPGPVVYAPAPVVVARPYYAYPRYGYWRRGYWR